MPATRRGSGQLSPSTGYSGLWLWRPSVPASEPTEQTAMRGTVPLPTVKVLLGSTRASRKGEASNGQVLHRGGRSIAWRPRRGVADAGPLRPCLPEFGGELGRSDLRGLLDGAPAPG